MLSSALLLLLPVQADALPTPPPGSREVSWELFSRQTFDPRYALPMPSAKEVGDEPRDLVAELRGWLERDLRVAADAASGAAGAADAAPFTVGDLIAAVQRPGMDSRTLERALETRARALPGLDASTRRRLVELLATRALIDENWSPDDSSSSDGVLHLPGWELRDKDAERNSPWRDRDGTDTVLRSAILVFSDLQTWNEIENEVALYKRFAGNSFEEVRIEPGSEVHAKRPGDEAQVQGRLFYTRSDLPWPFSDYEAVTHVRAAPFEDDAWQAEVYSRSSDFHWFAGRDTFLPVRTGEGDFVCWLLVQEFGFDLDGVPEGDSDRRAAVRTTLGNKKRLAEPRYAERRAAQESSEASMAEESSSSKGSVRGPK